MNLVFFKPVRSKTKFWQMSAGAPGCAGICSVQGEDKKSFSILDYCGNLEFFSLDPATAEGRLGETLSTKLFTTRLDLIAKMDHNPTLAATSDGAGELRNETASLLHGVVASMNLDNLVVRPKRQYVEKFAKAEAWVGLKQDDLHELASEVAPLPSEVESEIEDAKRLDLLNAQSAAGLPSPQLRFAKLRDQVIAIAGMLEEQANIPVVRAQLVLIEGPVRGVVAGRNRGDARTG